MRAAAGDERTSAACRVGEGRFERDRSAHQPFSAASTRRRNTKKCDSEKLTTKLAPIAPILPAASCALRSARTAGANTFAITSNIVVFATRPSRLEARNVA